MSAVRAQLGAAVHEGRPLSPTGVQERIFARLFTGLVYAQIWEDPEADMRALGIAEGEALVCIASGGCNVMSYLTRRPGEIAAADLSPAHVALLRLKLAAARHLPDHDTFFAMFGHADRASSVAAYDIHLAPHLDTATRAFWEDRGLTGTRRIEMVARGLYRHGALGRFLGILGAVARFCGADLRELADAPTLGDQKGFFDSRIAPIYDNRAIRWLARRPVMLFGLGIPPAQQRKLAADADGDIVAVLRERTRKLACDFPAAENYFLQQACHRRYRGRSGRAVPPYLDPRAFDAVRAGAAHVDVQNRSLTDLLAARPAASVDCATLLDAQDWMSDGQLADLWRELSRTARPGARVLFRTGGTPDILPGRVPPEILGRWRYDGRASALALAEDRSAIYGGVHLYRFEG
ncbi:S-adenosylmethionine:diacylglycerol 3-amino-3-carboxypropyl transferase [Roseivivax isoporae LMG 25204]|uniref:S-adenosylmethionine:diacylglycerol 3-amino-3-carboxypropyl transferase n=2 Tax=Roseivivax TaxID=93682 RepID=X7FBY4_9RHOB|nr:S-adenosylmethionine:diacylglycerol 3-amino-3-carboxypropyl transferase [Roseivivax isoporae LMG 25204]